MSNVPQLLLEKIWEHLGGPGAGIPSETLRSSFPVVIYLQNILATFQESLLPLGAMQKQVSPNLCKSNSDPNRNLQGRRYTQISLCHRQVPILL